MRLSERGGWTPIGDRTDKTGRVIVRIILADRVGNNTKGNITRTFSLYGATVTEVAQLTKGVCQELSDKVKASLEFERHASPNTPGSEWRAPVWQAPSPGDDN